ncbi:hypothetical protein [Globicatella sp. HMSC072A10]|uniref:hypothetical protein n=1 Tax=Globicatella sp. HMSC072A10 TaxID=1739315 RepID=UPI001438DEEC|nr:hypothetical protein [Globicatella sp. HMSC072A10]
MNQSMANQANFCVVAADNSLSPEVNQGDEVYLFDANEWGFRQQYNEIEEISI